MKIAYKKKYLLSNLIQGIVWQVFFWVGLFIEDTPSWIDYGWLIISVAYLWLYFQNKTYHYLSIDHEFIRKNWPFGKKISVKDIKWIRKFAGDYILKTNQKKMTINTQLIDPKSVTVLETELQKLNVLWI